MHGHTHTTVAQQAVFTNQAVALKADHITPFLLTFIFYMKAFCLLTL